MPRSPNHFACSDICRPERWKSKRAACSIQKPTSMSEMSTARLPVAYRDSGRSETAIAPAIGSQMSSEVRKVELMESSLGDEEGEDEGGGARGEEEDVGAEDAGLDPADEPAGVERRLADVGAALEDHGLFDLGAQRAGDGDGRGVEEPVVELVEVELVLEDALDGRQLRDLEALLGVDRPCDPDADKPGCDGRDGREVLERVRRLGGGEGRRG